MLLFRLKKQTSKIVAHTTFKQAAVSDHSPDCNHTIDFDHADIPASVNANKFRLFIKESLFIKSDQPQLLYT